ncbi:hypothetical protein Q2941_28790 [Bradyrhizobium sp. UFLA05-153]
MSDSKNLEVIASCSSTAFCQSRAAISSNAVLAAVGYNFRRLICWLRLLLWQFLATLFARPRLNPT